MSSVVSFLSINVSPSPLEKNNNYTPTNGKKKTV